MLNKKQNKFILNLLKENTKRLILNKLNSYYDCELPSLENMNFYITGKNKIYLSKIDLSGFENLRVVSVGLYFGTLLDNNNFRLSIEGSQLINPNFNYIIINENTLKSYLAAENIFVDEVLEENNNGKSPFFIVKYKNINLGVVSKKEKFYLNYVPKTRKLDFNKLY